MRRRPTVRVRQTRQKADKNFIGLAEKVFAILQLLAESPGTSLSRDEIAKSVTASRSSLDRLLYSIRKLGYVEETDDGTYRLARKFYSLSEVAVKHQYIPAIAKSVLNRLLSQYGESAHISVLENGLCVVVAAVESQYPVSFSAEVGEWNYVHTTAMGKCLLAYASSEERNAVIGQRGLPRLTDTTITDQEKFLQELEAVKERGYAVNLGETVEGITCVAAPIFNNQDRVIAALSISGPSYRMTKELDRIIGGIKPASTRLSLLLGCRSCNLDYLLSAA